MAPEMAFAETKLVKFNKYGLKKQTTQHEITTSFTWHKSLGQYGYTKRISNTDVPDLERSVGSTTTGFGRW